MIIPAILGFVLRLRNFVQIGYLGGGLTLGLSDVCAGRLVALIIVSRSDIKGNGGPGRLGTAGILSEHFAQPVSGFWHAVKR